MPLLIEHLARLKAQGCEIILVDGGSTDNSPAMAQSAGLRVLFSPPGRACQMNCGAHAAAGETLLFLHADTRLPDNAALLVEQALAPSGQGWGRFDIAISGSKLLLPVVAFLINCRSRVTGIATGDQALFVSRNLFEHVGGFPDQPLMEDIELSSRLRNIVRPACISTRASTSGRRWEKHGLWRTILLMWRLRFHYWRGVDPEQLARLYR